MKINAPGIQRRLADPGNFTGTRLGHKVSLIVIHVMDGTLEGTAAWFATGPQARLAAAVRAWERGGKVGTQPTRAAGSSAHYGVGVKGVIHQYVQEDAAAWHAGSIEQPLWPHLKKFPSGQFINPNVYSIGIEFEGRAGHVFTSEQYGAGARLIAWIASRHNIPISRETVCRHSDISPRSRPGTCPGAGCDMDRLIRQANEILSGGAA